MSVISVFEPQAEPHAAPAAWGLSDGMAPVSLRRAGARPLHFTGRLLAQRSGLRPGASVWHELRLHQIEAGGFVIDIRAVARSQAGGGQAGGGFHVALADTLEQALVGFEQYDPRADVSADFQIDDVTLNPVELLVHAAALRYRILETVTQYRAVLGRFLADLHAV